MIKVENIDVWGFEHAIRGMRNPMNSWEKSDSLWCSTNPTDCEKCPFVSPENDGSDGTTIVCTNTEDYPFIVGDNDLDLMRRLFKAGNEHRKYLRQITISMDIVAPIYWWKEYDTYKVGTTANSCSTMHKIHSKEFVLEDFSHEHLFDGISNLEGDSEMEYFENPTICLEYVCKVLNHYRSKYLAAEKKLKRDDLTDAERKHTAAQKKCFWWQMIQLLPSSYNQRRTVTITYENVVAIIRQRSGHKLDEWRLFVEILKSLPYIVEIMGGCTAE